MTILPDLIAGRRVLFVMALDAEYGTHLRARISPLMTGVGPVEAAVELTAALSRLAARDALPDLVVSLGSAGSRLLRQVEVYQVSALECRDMDASALGFPKGEVPLLGLPARIALPLRIPGVPEASLATGASVVSGRAYDGINADMVDMETYAVLRACQRFGLPLIGLRGISDGADEVEKLADWTQYLHLVDERLAQVVDRLAEALESGALTLPDPA